MQRTDTHRPSVINPDDYSFVAFEYLKDTDVALVLINREIINQHKQRTGGTMSRHAHGGNCHICGAHAIYTALFHHRPSNTYIRTGLDCAEKLDCAEDGDVFRKRIHNALEAKAGKAKAQAYLAKAGLERAWSIYVDSTVDRYEENTISDIVSKLVQYGSLSDKQISFIAKLIEKIDNRAANEAKWAAEREAAECVPVAETRMVVTGTIISIKETDFGTKMLVAHDTGWKVYGSVPSSLRGISRGDRVEFYAMVKRSDRDEKFGFFSRPTKAKIISGGE